ncbi:MAG: hypothetical protein V8R19_18975 [Bacteroides uniformis]
MKVNTIGLNSVRLNTIALNHIGEIRSGGGDSKPSPIPQWIREHVVFYYDVKKQGATNETLKESAYLQDLSGKGRRMKLFNFLFSEQSGVTEDYSLATDSIDDYGLVENLSSGVKMLFMTVNPMMLNVALYDQRATSGQHLFAVITESNKVAYNAYNTKGKTYINGVLNESRTSNELQNEKQIITIVNSEVNETNSLPPNLFRIRGGGLRIKCAFYNSIAFDSIPTEADGFTEQELIDYVLTNIIGQ